MEAPTHLLVLDAATMAMEKKSMHTTIIARTIDRCGGLQVGHGEVLEQWRVQAPPLWRSPRQIRCRSSLPPCLLLLVPHRGAPWVPSRSSTGTRDAALLSLHCSFAVVVSPIADQRSGPVPVPRSRPSPAPPSVANPWPGPASAVRRRDTLPRWRTIIHLNNHYMLGSIPCLNT